MHTWRPFAAWVGLSFLLHLLWETAQLPLYTIWLDPDTGHIAFAVFHCLLGDILIGAFTYGATALVLGDFRWGLTMPWRGAAIAVGLGVAYTAWSEWHNVYRAGSWAYMPSMPLVFGIGLSPLLEWIAVPITSLGGLRRFAWVRRAAPVQTS